MTARWRQSGSRLAVTAAWLLLCGSLVLCCCGVSTSDEVEYAEYLRALRQDIESGQLFAKSSSHDYSHGSALTPHIESNSYRYSEVFLNNLLKRVPLKGSFDNSLAESVDLVSECIKKEEASASLIDSEISLSKCDDVIEQIVLPRVVANNYLHRFPVLSEYAAVGSIAQMHSYWPAVMKLDNNAPMPVSRCPLGLHQLLFPLSAGNIRVRYFPLSTSSHFKPTMDNKESALPMHHIMYTESGFPETSSDPSKLPKYAEITLTSPSDFAFVPGNLLTSIMLQEDAVDEVGSDESPDVTISTTTTAILCRICFVDASNLNAFREEVALAAKASPYYRALKAHIEKSDFNVTMEMNPSDFRLRESISAAVTHAAETAVALEGNETAKEDSEAGEGSDAADGTTGTVDGKAAGSALEGSEGSESSDSSESSEESGAASRRRRSRGSRSSDASGSSTGSRSFSEWQEMKKWDVMIRALTMQPPAVPSIIAYGRTNVTLQWPATFLPSNMDTTLFGYKLYSCLVSAEDSAVIISENCSEYTFPRSPGGAKRVDGDDEKAYSTLFENIDERDNHVFSLVLNSNLQPGSRYRFRLISFYDESLTSPSGWSETVQMTAYTSPSAIPCLDYVKSLREAMLVKQSKAKRKKGESAPDAAVGVTEPFGSSVLGNTHSVEANVATDSPTVITLSFLRPLDDGDGKAQGGILGYNVYAKACPTRISDDGRKLGERGAILPFDTPLAKPQWHRVPYAQSPLADTGVERLTISAYFADAIYEFKVSAFNSLGDSPVSEISNKVETGVPTFPHRADEMLSSAQVEARVNPQGIGGIENYAATTVIDATPALHLGDINHNDANITGPTASASAVLAVDTVFQEVRVATAHKLPRNWKADSTALWAAQAIGWRCHWSPRLVVVGGPVWVSPALADTTVLNPSALQGKIVLVLRGRVPIVHKVRRIQAAGAVGIVLIDDGTCAAGKRFDQKCLPGASKGDKEGFAAHDAHNPWASLNIPVVFIHGADAKILLTTAGISLPSDEDPVVLRALRSDSVGTEWTDSVAEEL